MKRAFDIVMASVGLAAILPLLAALAIWIKLDSEGPVFYGGLRAGRFGRPFRIFKLRTMVENADQMGGAETAADDPRITRAGRFLRQYKLDELPQLMNVVRGEMSLVGPRPEVLEEVAQYTDQEREVLRVRPGITDWASLKFHHEGEILRGSSDPHRAYHEKICPEKMRLQIQYVQRNSLLADIMIIFRTFRAIFQQSEMGVIPTDSRITRNELLAMDGEVPVARQPFGSWPYYPESAVAAAASVLRSGEVNYWTGREGRNFEREFADYCGSKYAVAVANGSVALELALRALDVGPGDEVIVPSRTFIASASCALVCGATPVFADVDLVSQTLEVGSLPRLLSPRTKAIVAVHLAGWPCNMDPILEFAREHSLHVIEDCAQAHGATYKSRRVGSIGDVGAFSFCQDKIMSTGGEGGMVVTNDARLWERMWSYKDHGRDYASTNTKQGPGFVWIHASFGTNFRMTEMQSAIGRIQLKALDEQLETRRRNAAVLTEHFRRIPGLRVSLPPPEIGHAYYKYYAFLEPERLASGWNRDRVLAAICAEGIPCGVGSCSEVYLEKAFPPSMRPPARLPNARWLGETSLMFQVHPTLSQRNIQETCLAVEKVMHAATDYTRWRFAA
jgi:hypothetical protein